MANTKFKITDLDTAHVYIPDEGLQLEKIPSLFLEMFKNYTNLPEDQILPHILSVRKAAWEFLPYPTIGLFYFLEFQLCQNPTYQRILYTLKSGGTFLDLGCCFGQDIRKLITDGAPAGNIFGADLHPEYIELGHKLFCDGGSRLASRFIAPADVFDTGVDAALCKLEGQMDVVHVASFLHLFGWDDQVIIANRIAKILKGAKGALVVGHQIGSGTPGEYGHWASAKGALFKHDETTFRKLWATVPGNWKVVYELIPVKEGAGLRLFLDADPDVRLFRFTVERV